MTQAVSTWPTTTAVKTIMPNRNSDWRARAGKSRWDRDDEGCVGGFEWGWSGRRCGAGTWHLGLFHQHHWDTLADRVASGTGITDQAVAIAPNTGFAHGA